ncbi:MAG: 2-C-methyl-D-erythritol 4-phosphate cytidylyltransferase [Acidimicrobiia bacterium]|nr:2-C-methyl-D-erythritol 4-phosphate cytidylyltransferase [Acidimicrobiia bacterium]MCY4433247.1 2-C-methyl-D-erythritol 4-phosphate cytidylyltransferase [bacterium]
MATQPSVWTVIVAAGSGTRFGGAKQYLELAGTRVVDRSVAVAAQVSDGVVVVVPASDVSAESARLAADSVVAGGPSRAASVRNGLTAVPPDAAIICVHDAARPLAGADVYQRVINEVRSGAGGAVPVVPVTDTIRRVDGGVVDRSALQAVQTPQAFRGELLRAAHDDAGDATDDASLVEAAGFSVVAVQGHSRNIKITHPDDLAAAEAWLAT